MQILHTADIHLDSPLSGLAAKAGGRANELVGATRRAFSGMVDFAIETGVQLVLIAGDLYDGDWKDFSTGLFFVSEMARLNKAGIRAAVVKGNHDAENHMTRSLSWPENVRVFGAERAETWVLEDLGVAIHGRSFPRRDVTENLAARYPEPKAGLLNIGLLHTAADGTLGHGPYAPCSLAELIGKGYDYWALGHVHARSVLSQAPWVVFPGNLQGRHVNEPGPKGATLLTVRDGAIAAAEHVDLDVVRWAHLRVDLGGCTAFEVACSRIQQALSDAADDADSRTLACRVTLLGTTSLHPLLAGDLERTTAECVALAELVGGDVWLERVLVETCLPAETPTVDADAIAALLTLVDEIKNDPVQLDELRTELGGALGRMPPPVRKIGELEVFDDRVLNTVLDGASAILRHRLLNPS